MSAILGNVFRGACAKTFTHLNRHTAHFGIFKAASFFLTLICGRLSRRRALAENEGTLGYEDINIKERGFFLCRKKKNREGVTTCEEYARANFTVEAAALQMQPSCNRKV